MNFPRNPAGLCRRAAAILFLLAFAVIGVRGILQRNKVAPVIDGTGPQCCTDATLKLFFGVSGGSRIISGHLAGIPPGHPLVIFFPENSPDADLASQVVGTVAWPREVLMAPVNPAQLPQVVNNIQKLSIGGMIFCGMTPPPSLPAGEILMPRLWLVPAEAK